MSKAQIINELKHKKISKEMMMGYRLATLVFTTELDDWQFTPEEIDTFLNDSHEKLQMYAQGELDVSKWVEAVEKYTNIDAICEIDQKI